MSPSASTADLLEFLGRSTTPFHAVAGMAERLEAAGFQRLRETDSWSLADGGRYYVIRNDSSLIAFQTGQQLSERGLRMVGAHTDSPCLKVKPNPELHQHGALRLGVEVYGGVLMNPWFDRDLSLAGRVHYRDQTGQLRTALVDFRDPIAVVPSLAIHLDREANQNRSVNPQQELPPLVQLTSAEAEPPGLRTLLAERIAQEQPQASVDQVLDYELCFYDTQPPAIVGLRGEFIASARLDNLLSCWCGLQALLAADPEVPSLLVCNDHEEVGSASSAGAAGPFLRSTLERLSGPGEAWARLIARSMLISADNAHALHPNYSDRHDGNHGPALNGGPVIKINANQRYASNSATQAVFRQVCTDADVPVQAFVVRTDMACGSTIGPITATELGVRTLDIGVPQLAMHSIRELCGSADPDHLVRALTGFFQLRTLPAEID